MPACITHKLFSNEVLKDLSVLEGFDPTAYAWGAQGPDFLFCHRYFPWMKGKSLRQYGNRLHKEDPVKTLGAVREFLRQRPDPSYQSYAWGLLCHYSLDSTAHPYINFLADRLVEERPYENRTTMHGEIEAALDAIVLRYETGKLPSEVSLGKLFPKNEAVQRRIAKVYHNMIFRVYGEDVPEPELYRATADAHFVFSLLTDRTGLKLKIFRALEKGKPSLVSSHLIPITERDDVDYANIQNAPWLDGEEEHTESFLELFEKAQALAKALITEYDTCDLKAVTRQRPFG